MSPWYMHRMALNKLDQASQNLKLVRAAFIRKVFLLLSLMLFVITLMTSVPFIHRPLISFMQEENDRAVGLISINVFIFAIIYLPMAFIRKVRRSIICASILTIFTGFITSSLTAYTEAEVFLLTLVMTLAMCGLVVLFNLQTKSDFVTSGHGRLLFSALAFTVVGTGGALSIYVFKIKDIYVFIAAQCSVIFIIWLVIDLQMLIKGQRSSAEISVEDYTFTAIQLFLDMFIIFWIIWGILMVLLCILGLCMGGGHGDVPSCPSCEKIKDCDDCCGCCCCSSTTDPGRKPTADPREMTNAATITVQPM
ncbi:inhibitor of apoptosis-promoting bax1 domain-containing protein [Ditylenchus destructor]|uniref:Inhibitor of apoptosis-promoting bax1 domain-containing protein n=1 Tax=Ditylenchus destructor TaxID=166010 RepID=A0AAD4R522_9BILA|nr:inhibitor of apoptosis-promoting bax1 domain-containing protein [Ditylenchus destructor]